MTGDERTLLGGFVDFLRATVHVKCEGLPESAARKAVLPSPLTTVAGLVSHLRWVEHFWFEAVLAGRENRAPWALSGADRDADWWPPAEASLDQLLREYAAQCEISREIVAGLPLDHEVPFRGGTVSVRWVLVHMVEETARHAGHLDAVRELLDGVTGE